MTPTVRPLDPTELTLGALVAARGMRDNPLHLAALGSDPQHRIDYMRRNFTKILGFDGRTTLGAWEDGRLVGVACQSAPGACKPTVGQQLTLVPALVRAPRSSMQLGRWMATWGRHDPSTPHVHLGPVAVDLDRQGQGIGTHLLRAHAAALDEAGAVGYLETDKEVNVAFYERVGYEVIGDADVIGVPCWFMQRTPRGSNEDPPADRSS